MAKRALIVVDMLNSYDFEGADALAESAADAVPVIAGLIERAREEGVDVIYVNDNYGHWNSSRRDRARERLPARRMTDEAAG